MRKQHSYYVYITTNPKKSVLYVGVTNNLARRLVEHYANRGNKTTFAGRYFAYNLIYCEHFQYINQAIAREKELKKWNRRPKEKLIATKNPKWIFFNDKFCGEWPPHKAWGNYLTQYKQRKGLNSTPSDKESTVCLYEDDFDNGKVVNNEKNSQEESINSTNLVSKIERIELQILGTHKYMTKKEILDTLLASKIIAIIRLDSSEPVYKVADALYKGGVIAIEVTMGTPNALKEIAKLARHDGILPGVGSVVDAAMAKAAIEAGAEFIVTPTTKLEVIKMAHYYGKPVLSGALTPTEILQAYEWGADVIKLFPAGIFGLPYFKAVKAPMPYIPIMPTGGVTIENATAWLESGAVCLGVGSTLVNKKLIAQEDFPTLTEIAKKMRNVVDNNI